jgi:hypothetical protein
MQKDQNQHGSDTIIINSRRMFAMNIGERIITSLGGMIAKDGDEIKKRSFEAG